MAMPQGNRAPSKAPVQVARSKIKEIVRECLLEILSEGILPAGQNLAEGRSSARDIPSKVAPKRVQRTPAPDTGNFDKAVRSAAASVTNDPVLQMMLEDTARTTYQEQVSADRPTSMGELGRLAGIRQDDEIPTPAVAQDGDSKWAALAFAPKVARSLPT